MRLNTAILVCGLVLAGGVGGCTSRPQAETWRQDLARLPYPKEAPMGEDLDIVVESLGGDVEVTNRTPYSFEDVQLWLNQQYVARVPRITIGADQVFPLDQFINEHGEPFPTGGLLTPDRAFPVVLAELYDPATSVRYRLRARPEP